MIKQLYINRFNALFFYSLSLIIFFYITAWNVDVVFCEAKPGAFGFQDPATPIAEGIINIHHHIMYYLTVVFITVCWVLARIIYRFGYQLNRFSENKQDQKLFRLIVRTQLNHYSLLEVVWTIIPSIILYFIAVPSFILLYSIDEIVDPALTIKAIGHQWYWAYEYSDYVMDWETIEFDSYMLAEDELELGQLRLLEVDNPIVLPIHTHVRVIVTAADVLHSWAVPSLGIKVDAVPGRLNQGSIFLKRLGVFYGQCSEICGVNHGFMPIVVKSVTLENYIQWLQNKLEL